MLDFIEKYKFAIIGTLLFHVAVFAYTNFSTLKRPYKQPDPDIEIAMPLEDIIVDPEMMEMLDMKDQQLSNQEITNTATDENDEREMSFEEFSRNNIDESVNKSVEELEQEYKDYWASRHEGQEPSGGDVQDPDDEVEEPNINNNTNQNNQSNTNTSDKAFAGRAIVRYNLPNRKEFSLPAPGYLCKGAGLVVINIKVDRNGTVKSTSYNSTSSKSATDCMIEMAEKYAKKSRFNLDNSAASMQDGTITYEFLGQ